MASRKISQAVARQLLRENRELRATINQQRNAWRKDFPGGVHLGTAAVSERLYGEIHAARKLNHAVVVTAQGPNEVFMYALPLAEKGA